MTVHEQTNAFPKSRVSYVVKAKEYEVLSSNETEVDLDLLVAAERERIKAEFYATYDVMTGVRIAATLGCMFALMVFLIVYKSRSETSSVLDDPEIAATAAAVLVEEEEREIQEVWEATRKVLLEEDFNLDLDNNSSNSFRPRMLSLGNISAPPMLNRSTKLSPVSGGYSSFSKSPRRYSTASYASATHLLGEFRKTKQHQQQQRAPLMISSKNNSYRSGKLNGLNSSSSSFKTTDIRSFPHQECDGESEGEEADDELDNIIVTAEVNYHPNVLLSVPKGQESRRSSEMTCCSTESSFLERRISALSLGINSLPSVSQCPSRRASFRCNEIDLEKGDTRLRPNIEVIKATPYSSPVLSEKNVGERQKSNNNNTVDGCFDSISEYPEDDNPNKRQSTYSQRAPLASLSSFKLSSVEYQDSDEIVKSVGSDAVFYDYCADTEDEMDQLSLNSDTINAFMPTVSNLPCQPKSILKNSVNNNSHVNKCICDSIRVQADNSENSSSEKVILKNRDKSVSKTWTFRKPNIFSKIAQTFETKAIDEKDIKCSSDSMIQRIIEKDSNSKNVGNKISSRSNSISHIHVFNDNDNEGENVKVQAQICLTARLVDAASDVNNLSSIVVSELPGLTNLSEKPKRKDEAETQLTSSLDMLPGSGKKFSRETLF